MRLPLLEPAPASTSIQPSRRPALPALTGLRTILALNILLFHFTPSYTGAAAPFIDHGFVFVGFFFLLSGYVLAYNYADRALTLNQRQFWLARFARLYPIYVLALLLSVPTLAAEWQAHTPADFYRGLILTPLLLQGWSPALATFWNTVGWTLSAELLLYALFPFLLRAWELHVSTFDSPACLIAMFAAFWLLGMLPHLTYLALNPDHLSSPVDRYTYATWLRALKYSPPAYLCTFVAGMALGKLHLALALSAARRLAIGIAGVLLTGVFFFTAADRVPYILLHGGLLLPIFALLTLGLSGNNVLASVFAFKPLLAVGETTFCLYMLHFNTINLIHQHHVWERLHLAAYDLWLSYATVLLLAFAAHHLIERPARKWLLGRLLPAFIPAKEERPASAERSAGDFQSAVRE